MKMVNKREETNKRNNNRKSRIKRPKSNKRKLKAIDLHQRSQIMML